MDFWIRYGQAKSLKLGRIICFLILFVAVGRVSVSPLALSLSFTTQAFPTSRDQRYTAQTIRYQTMNGWMGRELLHHLQRGRKHRLPRSGTVGLDGRRQSTSVRPCCEILVIGWRSVG